MRTRIPAAIGLSTALIATLAACASQAPTGVVQEAAPVAEPSGSWTVLTYSIADTNLEDFMMTDLEELGDVGTQEGLNLVALVDRSDEYTDVPVLGLPDWTGGKLIEIGQNEATVLDDMGDINTGDPDVLADFIATGIAEYPADNYALIISDHGASWPGVGADGSSDNDTLSLAELHTAVADGLASAGIDKLDLLGFDACLMATYEVASELAPVANRLVASQELEPGHGWDYTALDEVAEDGRATVDELGSAIIDGFKNQAADQGTDAGITLSMIDLNQMDAVNAALTEFTEVLVDRADGIGPTVGRTLADTLGFGQSPDPDQDTWMTDLAIFTSEIGVNLLFASDAADDLTRAINDAVLDRVDGQATQGATGMSIYFPPTVDNFDRDYRDLANLGGWTEFLTAYYGVGADIPKPPVLGDAQLTFGPDGATIVGTFNDATADNLAEAFIRYGVVESDGSITFLGEEDAELSDDGSSTATGTYSLATLELSDGVDSVSAYLALYPTEDPGVVIADIPMSYYSPDGENQGDLLLDGTIDATTGDVLSATYYVYDEDSATYGEFAPEPDWIIVPQVLMVAPDGTEDWVLTSDVGLYADPDGLTYELIRLPTGATLYLELVVVDFGGNYASVSGTATVPPREG